jgi:hypothetical protein
MHSGLFQDGECYSKYTTGECVILLLNTLEINRRHIQILTSLYLASWRRYKCKQSYTLMAVGSQHSGTNWVTWTIQTLQTFDSRFLECIIKDNILFQVLVYMDTF